MDNKFTMSQAAKELGVAKSTLYRWEKAKKIAAPKRLARTNERIYTKEDIEKIREWKDKTVEPPSAPKNASRTKAGS